MRWWFINVDGKNIQEFMNNLQNLRKYHKKTKVL